MNNNTKKILIVIAVIIIALIVISLFLVPFITNKLKYETEKEKLSKAKSEANIILAGIESECATNELKYSLGNLDEDDIVCSQQKDLTNYVPNMVALKDVKVKKAIYEDGKITKLIIITDGYTLTLVNGEFDVEKN